MIEPSTAHRRPALAAILMPLDRELLVPHTAAIHKQRERPFVERDYLGGGRAGQRGGSEPGEHQSHATNYTARAPARLAAGILRTGCPSRRAIVPTPQRTVRSSSERTRQS